MKKGRFSKLTIILLVFVTLFVSFTFTSCSKKTELSFNEGTYTATAMGKNGPVELEVIFSKTAIKAINILKHSETTGLGDVALTKIAERITENQSLTIDAVSGATFSSIAVITAVGDCAVQAGADLSSLQLAIDKATAGKKELLVADVVVIGAGASGASAAVTAAENGAKVILLEKNINPGGTTAMGGGLFGAYSSLMEAEGEAPVDTEALFRDWMKEMVWKADANLVKKYLKLSYTTVDWLIGYGFEFHKVAAVQQTHDTYHGYHKYNDFTKTTEKFINFIDKGLLARGGQVFYETPAIELMNDGAGNVTGVIARKLDGTILEITAKSVVIASGGFVGDESWVAQSLDGVHVTTAGLASNVGDGIKMAWGQGAAHRGDNVHLAHVTKIEGDLSSFPETSWLVNTSLAYLPTNPWVNFNGLRFADEDIVYDRAFTTNALIAQGNYIFTIISQQMIDSLEKGGASAVGMEDPVAMGPMAEVTPMKMPWGNLNAMIAELVTQNIAFKGDTYASLAEAAGMNVNKFTENMKIYNDDAKAHKDTVFGKRSAHMTPLGDGPYYAVKVIPTNLCTLGGIRINEDFQVVGSDPNSYTPIGNLYSAGADAGGLYSDHYVLLEGGAQGWAYNSGRMAGAEAASNALNKKIDL